MATKQIVLIEDNHHDELLTLRALAKNESQTEVTVLRDGVDARDFISQFMHDQKMLSPDLILLDLKLPRIGGLELLHFIRQSPRLKHVPVVVLTSSLEENDVVESYAAGANSYVRKQVNFVNFTEVLMRLETYWLQINEKAAVTA